MRSLAEISENGRRELARRHIETLESWLRRLIDYQLRNLAGEDYRFANHSGSPLVPRRILEETDKRIAREPHRYPRWIDATQLNEAIGIIRHNYNAHFRAVFAEALPDEVVRYFLAVVEAHRNPLMHGGTCNTRMLEQSICYSEDIIEACKKFFSDTRQDKHFDAPTFTRFADSKGNVFHVTTPEGQQNIFDARRGNSGTLYIGDALSFEVEVDESFDRDQYDIHWYTFWGVQKGEGPQFRIELTAQNVNDQEEVRAVLVSRKEWHRLGVHDDMISVLYRVLPR